MSARPVDSTIQWVRPRLRNHLIFRCRNGRLRRQPSGHAEVSAFAGIDPLMDVQHGRCRSLADRLRTAVQASGYRRDADIPDKPTTRVAREARPVRWSRVCPVSSGVALAQHSVGREDVGMTSSQPVVAPGPRWTRLRAGR